VDIAVVLTRRQVDALRLRDKGLLPDFPEDFNDDLCVMDTDGSDIVNLTNTTKISENWPSWRPAPNRHG
jgi:hypothetical protein